MLKYTVKLLLLGLVFFSFNQVQAIGANSTSFSIYLVRHAEKQITQKDPELTRCGLLRATNIAKQLELIKFDHVYSTKYKRTKQTAAPIAQQENITTEYYDPSHLPEFANALIAKQKNSLVVGHSNTTAVLAGLLVAESGEAFDESVYDRIYQVVFIKGVPHMQILQQGFTCH